MFSNGIKLYPMGIKNKNVVKNIKYNIRFKFKKKTAELQNRLR